MGRIFSFGERFKVPNNARDTATQAQSGSVVNGYDPALPANGGDTNYHMQQTNWTQFDGRRMFTFLEDFYFRIYLFPPELDYGTFSQDTTLNMRIWNAYFGNTVFVSSIPALGDEVTMGGEALPATFTGLEVKVFPFTAEGDGETILSDVFTLTFDTDNFADDVFFVPVSGFRVPVLTDLVWPFEPNWAGRYTMEYEFSTDIITSANGREQRRQIRQTPRKSFEFSVGPFRSEDRREFTRLLTANQGGRFYVPELTRYVETTTPIDPEGIIVEVDEVPWWLSQTDAYVILQHGTQLSLRKINYVGSSSNSEDMTVFFKSDDNFSWPVGTRIYPAISSWMADEISAIAHTNFNWTATMRFLGLPGLEPKEPLPLPPHVYNERELFLTKPNYARPPDVAQTQTTSFIDYGFGRMQRNVDFDYQQQRWSMTYLGRNFEDAEKLRQFFFRCGGRAREFYMPTWSDDIIVRDDIIASDNRIAIDGIEFASVYADDPVRFGAGVVILLFDGTVIYRQIADIYAEPDSNDAVTSYVEFTELINADIDVIDIDRVCWVPLWRHATDTLTVEWHTRETCEMSFTLQMQPWFPPDDLGSNS